MEFEKMTMDELQLRLNDLANAEDAETALEEVRGINAEIEKRIKAENAKEELRKAIAEGKAVTTTVEVSSNEVRKMDFDVNSKEYRDLWLKNVQGTMTKEERDGYTQGSTYATHAIPTIIANKFFEKMKVLAPMLNEIMLMRAAGDLQFVCEGVRNTATKHTENSAIGISADTTVAVKLSAYEFYKIVAISESAKVMSVDDFEGWLVNMLAGDIARAIDNYILNDASNGIAAGTYTTNTNQILNTASYTYKNIVDLVALLPAAYDAEAKFVVNKKTLYSEIANITNSSGNPIFVQDTENGMVGRILGYPVVVDDYVTTTNKAVYLGAWKNVVGNLSKDMNVISYPDYDYGRTKFRGEAIFDSKVALSEAIVRLVSTTA